MHNTIYPAMYITVLNMDDMTTQHDSNPSMAQVLFHAANITSKWGIVSRQISG